MNNMSKITCLLLIVLVALFGNAQSAEHEPPFAMRIFMDVCVAGNAGSATTGQHAKALGFTKASKERAAQYLQARKGKAWALENEHGTFGVTYLTRSGHCSVIVHRGEAAVLQAGMEGSLPSADSGLTYIVEAEPDSGDLSTTTYDIFQGETILERWVITTSSNPESNVRAILSYDTP